VRLDFVTANFSELRYGEVRRKHLVRSSQNYYSTHSGEYKTRRRPERLYRACSGPLGAKSRRFVRSLKKGGKYSGCCASNSEAVVRHRAPSNIRIEEHLCCICRYTASPLNIPELLATKLPRTPCLRSSQNSLKAKFRERLKAEVGVPRHAVLSPRQSTNRRR
jgi:hypothetical protein